MLREISVFWAGAQGPTLIRSFGLHVYSVPWSSTFKIYCSKETFKRVDTLQGKIMGSITFMSLLNMLFQIQNDQTYHTLENCWLNTFCCTVPIKRTV